MTEDRLSGLFDEIRNESAQTSISEVNQWIDAAVTAGATVGLLATLKLILIKKPLIMWTTLLTVTGGASLGVVMLFSKPEIQENPVKKETTTYAAPAKVMDGYREKETAVDEPVEDETPGLEEPIGEPNSETPNLPEDLGALIPLRTVKSGSPQGIPAYRKPQVTESFTKVHISGALYVELTQGKACSILIEPETAKDLVVVEIQNGTLYLKNAPAKKDRKERIVVRVCVQDLVELHMSGATSLIGPHQLGLDQLSLDLAGASNVSLNLKASKLKGDFSGASNVEIVGTCGSVDLDVSGAAQAQLADLSVKKATVDNSGAGHLEISVSENLKADGSGASVTYYRVEGSSGTVSIDVETSGSATVKKK